MILWLTFWCGSSRSRIFFWDGSASGEKGRFQAPQPQHYSISISCFRFKLSKLCENILSCVKIWLRWRPEPAVGEPSPASSRGARGTGRAHSRGHRLPPAGNKRTCCWKSCFNVNCKTYCMVDFPPKMVANFSYLSPSQLGKKIHYCVCFDRCCCNFGRKTLIVWRGCEINLIIQIMVVNSGFCPPAPVHYTLPWIPWCVDSSVSGGWPSRFISVPPLSDNWVLLMC